MKLIKLKKLSRVALVVAMSAATTPAGANADGTKTDNAALENNQYNHWHDAAQRRVPFPSNTKVTRQFGELSVQIETKAVFFGYELDNIAAIGSGGYLHLSSDNGRGSISLTASSDDNGNIVYDYRINDYPVRHQVSARQFLSETLDKLLGKDDTHAWRLHVLKHLADPALTESEEKMAQQEISRRGFRAVLDNHDGLFSVEDRTLADELLSSSDWRESGQQIFSGKVLSDRSPFDESMIVSDANFASLDEQGVLRIYHFPGQGQTVNVNYNLNNDTLLSAFLSATGQPYRKGESEKGLADFLLRTHWQRPSNKLSWHKVHSQSARQSKEKT